MTKKVPLEAMLRHAWCAEMESTMTFRRGVSGPTRFGKRWRADVRKSLVALGVEPPSLDRNQI
jgi:hypothetical protein